MENNKRCYEVPTADILKSHYASKQERLANVGLPTILIIVSGFV